MSSFAPVKQDLAERLRAREVRRLVYFHCDHFEPWQQFEGRSPVDQRHVDELGQFGEDLARIDYARRLTLFYRTAISFAHDRSREMVRAAPDDLFGIIPRHPAVAALARSGMKALLAAVPHEIQIHVHHEGMTCNTSHKVPEVLEWHGTERGRALDGDRLALILRCFKAYIAEETDLDLQRWFFVHGHWALQGSDPDTCTIADELRLLMAAGCRGDFTFPAGRVHVNPTLELPYLCRPINQLRGYDDPASDPVPALGNRAAAEAGRFLIWSSVIKHRRSSIDYFAPWVRQALEQPEEWARDVVETSYVADGTLYFKTHAHSMFPYYREAKRRPVYPHAHPGLQTLFTLVFDAASSMCAEVEFLTASEVYDRLLDSAAPAMAPASPPLPPVVWPEPAAGPRPGFIPDSADIGPLDLDGAIALVTRIGTTVMRARIGRLGDAGSGAFNL